MTCHHPKRQLIEASIVGGVSLSALQRTYGMDRDAIRRHRDNHMSPALQKVLDAKKPDATGRTLLSRVERLLTDAEQILDAAKEQGKPGLALQAISQARGLLDVYGKATGELKPDGQVNVQVMNLQTDPSWIAARQAILNALRAHPEAMGDVVSALRRLDTPGPAEIVVSPPQPARLEGRE